MNADTILGTRKRLVRVSKEETLLILRAYREHPTNWAHIIADMKENLQQLSDPAKALYRTGTVKQLKDRMSAKLSKLMASWDKIADQDIRQEVELIRQQERRQVHPVRDQRQFNENEEPRVEVAPPADDDIREEPAVAVQQAVPRRQLVPPVDLFNVVFQPENEQAPVVELPVPVDQPNIEIQDVAEPIHQQPDRRDGIAAAQSDSDSDQEPQPRRRRLADLIRENNELYNNFMRNTVPRILREFGIDD